MTKENEEKKDEKEQTEQKDDALVEDDKKFKLKGKRILIIIIGAVILLAGVGALIFFNVIKTPLSKDKAQEEKKDDKSKLPLQTFYYEMKTLVVNLNSSVNRSNSFLKVTVIFEVEGQENMNSLTGKLPRIEDLFNTYLRELRPQDLQGSAGIYLLREELLLRVNQAIYPQAVKDILFKELQIN